jgi:hypothetical protein
MEIPGMVHTSWEVRQYVRRGYDQDSIPQRQVVQPGIVICLCNEPNIDRGGVAFPEMEVLPRPGGNPRSVLQYYHNDPCWVGCRHMFKKHNYVKVPRGSEPTTELYQNNA